ncbi:hypothetical protein N7532_002167 [Penicillium argentinense]|uniref:Major facilitator superfamily (MFS) profile domain-containing protein n=1 Tax=Penicillium argentinense TaxID=1131581 RepID=A0A9W9KN62_9EURO|nr:uncharacterized protein N7532_002167 [Penicillium argentinense]KAJ5111632.1 hypothetical protein N7532_002167 [Penicillium argentinense]
MESYRVGPLSLNSTPVDLIESQPRPSPTHDDFFHTISTSIPSLAPLSEEAHAATTIEHRMTFRQGCHLYPKAIAWSVLLSMAIVLEAYGTILINGFLGFPAFRETYGTPTGRQGYEISAAWQAGLINAAYAGQILGLLFNGVLTDRYGYQRVMVGCLVILSLFLLLIFFARNIQMLVSGYVLCGLPWGALQTLSMTYAAEVMPVALRAYLTSNINNCWLLGQLVGAGMMRIFISSPSQWSYRIPLALQWTFLVPILIGILFAPESPWWLVRHEKNAQAEKALLRLTSAGPGNSIDVHKTLAMLRHTNEVEKYLSGGGASYLSCFRGTDLRRTEVACMVWITQSLCGAALTGYAVYFYEQAGLSTSHAITVGIGVFGSGIVGGFLSWIWLRIIGRRTIYLCGLILLFIVLMIAGGMSTLKERQTTSWVLGSLIIVLTFIYDTTIGPVCYVLVAEIPSSLLRNKTVVLARVAYSLSSVIVNTVTTRMLNPTAWHWGVKVASYLLALPSVVLSGPISPKGLTYLELDILFSKNASARKFRQFRERLERSGYFSLARMDRPDSLWDPR